MAWPTRSKLLAIRKDTNHNAATRLSLGGPAASHTWLVKLITVSVMSGASKTFRIYIERAGVVYQVESLGPSAVATATTRLTNIVIHAGDILSYNLDSGLTGDCVVSLHGANLG